MIVAGRSQHEPIRGVPRMAAPKRSRAPRLGPAYRFRPGRGCKVALRVVNGLLRQVETQLVDADPKSYFDNISQGRSEGTVQTVNRVFGVVGVVGLKLVVVRTEASAQSSGNWRALADIAVDH